MQIHKIRWSQSIRLKPGPIVLCQKKCHTYYIFHSIIFEWWSNHRLNVHQISLWISQWTFFFIPNTKSNMLNNRSLVSKVTKIMCLSIYVVHVFSRFYFRNEINQKWWWYIFDRDLNILKVFECIFLCKNSNAYCITFHETNIIFFLNKRIKCNRIKLLPHL